MASLAASHPPMQHGITVRGQRKSKNEIARFRALKRQNLAISEQAAAPKATLHQPLSLCSRATKHRSPEQRRRSFKIRGILRRYATCLSGGWNRNALTKLAVPGETMKQSPASMD